MALQQIQDENDLTITNAAKVRFAALAAAEITWNATISQNEILKQRANDQAQIEISAATNIKVTFNFIVESSKHPAGDCIGRRGCTKRCSSCVKSKTIG